MNCCITELVSNCFLSSVLSCVAAKHTMWTSDYIASLSSNKKTDDIICFCISELDTNNCQGRKKNKHNLFGPDFPRTFPTLAPGCPGEKKKVLLNTGAAGKRTFWCGRPRFSVRTSRTRRVLEKLCTKKVCVDFLAPKLCDHFGPNGTLAEILKGRSSVAH